MISVLERGLKGLRGTTKIGGGLELDTPLADVVIDTPLQTILAAVEAYADNAAAVTAGLEVGELYRTLDVLKVVHA